MYLVNEKNEVKKRFLKWFFVLIIPVASWAIIYFSPFGNHEGFNYKLVQHTVEINAPATAVFGFLGNSANASKWSVFVNHISPLNADIIPDGRVGSRRRCFTRADETGTQWDELITEVIPATKRQLTIYNMKGFTMSEHGLATEQLYESPAPDKTRLTFTVFYKDRKPGIIGNLKTYIAAYRIKSIFNENMNNIKKQVEEAYKSGNTAASSH
jgi:hypothetical protein